MFVTVTEAIDRMRNHLDADEVAIKQWISDGTAVRWLNEGLYRLHRRLIRAGMVHPKHTDVDQSSFGANGSIPIGLADETEPSVIYWVAEVSSDGALRYLTPQQQLAGPVPYAKQPVTTRGAATSWWAERDEVDGGTGIINIRLNPTPSDGTYRAAYQKKPETLTISASPGPGEASGYFAPFGLENYPILYATRMAFARGGEMPPSVTSMIQECEMELDLAEQTLMQGQGPAVRNVDREMRGWTRRTSSTGSSPLNPANWMWL